MSASEGTAERLVQHYAVAADTETEIAVSTETTGVVIQLPVAFDIMDLATHEYARLLREFWPEAKVWARVDDEKPRTLHIAVQGQEWDAAKEHAAYRVRSAVYRSSSGLDSVFLEVDVRFADNAPFDLDGFEPA